MVVDFMILRWMLKWKPMTESILLGWRNRMGKAGEGNGRGCLMEEREVVNKSTHLKV